MKMMKNGMKIVSICLVILMFLGVSMSCVYASSSDSDKEAYIQIQEKGTKLLNAYLWFGYALSLGMVVYIGIRYMLGAADARANMKSAITGWLIGAFVVFMATTIIAIILNLANPNGDNVESMANEIVKAAGVKVYEN